VIIGTLSGMNECENCGESVDSRWKFCLNCGARMPVRTLSPSPAPEPTPSVVLSTSQPLQLQPSQPYREAASYQAERSYPTEPEYSGAPEYGAQAEYVPRSDYERAMDVDESSAGNHVGKRKFRFDWQLALGVVLALGGVAMIVYLVVVLIVPHS
jgi:hypothetical protein